MSRLAQVIASLSAARRVTAEDVIMLRRLVFSEIEVTRAEAEALIALDEKLEETTPEWRMMFVEALTDFVVRQQRPTGYVDDGKAEWLMSVLARDDRMRTSTELEVLIKVLEVAESAPPRLAAFALERVKAAVTDDGRITEREVERIRRIIYAYGGQGVIGVTREEAEALFDINDAVRGGGDLPAWTDLFVKAIANCLLSAASYAPPTRQEALGQEYWLRSRGDILLQMRRVLGPVDVRGLDLRSELDRAWKARDERVDAEAAEAAFLTTAETNWVLERLQRDGVRDPAEQALLAFLQAEAHEPEASLSPLAERAA